MAARAGKKMNVLAHYVLPRGKNAVNASVFGHVHNMLVTARLVPKTSSTPWHHVVRRGKNAAVSFFAH